MVHLGMSDYGAGRVGACRRPTATISESSYRPGFDVPSFPDRSQLVAWRVLIGPLPAVESGIKAVYCFPDGVNRFTHFLFRVGGPETITWQGSSSMISMPSGTVPSSPAAPQLPGTYWEVPGLRSFLGSQGADGPVQSAL